ncbi:MAG: hypothetical protein ACKV2Q_09380 [Planctomycetaceae bacterium]
MKQPSVYQDLKGRELTLDELPAGEQKLISDLRSAAKKAKDWSSFSNLWMPKVSEFYSPLGLTRPQIRQTAGYRVAQDLDSRLAIANGQARVPDYRDELESLIGERFQTRREFCEATGLTEDMLSHVLSKRKHLAINTLEESLRRIGYTLHIAPLVEG